MNRNQAPVEYEPLNKYKESTQEVDLSRDYSTVSVSGDVEVLFRDIQPRLIRDLIELPKNHVVIGCVAWLTAFQILRALYHKSLGIVVQKEEFLRPDKLLPTKEEKIEWSKILRGLYAESTKPQFNVPPTELPSFNFETRLDEIKGYQHAKAGDFRCIGYLSTERNERSTIPLMHHKFLVFVEIIKKPIIEKYQEPRFTTEFRPYKVWTGSFNMSENASNSLENVVIMTDPKIVQAYCQEWANLYFNSESLDWTNEYFYPNDDFRVHT